MPEKKETQCPDGCTQFTTLGSNAYYAKSTCLVCGWGESKKITTAPRFSADECRHENTNRTGSTKSHVRFWCKDCCTFIDVRERGDVEAVEQTAEELMHASTDQQVLAGRILDEGRSVTDV